MTDSNFDILDRLEEFAQERGHAILDLAFAWLLANPAVDSVIAGVSKVEQVIVNAKTAEWQLTEGEMAEIDSILKS